MMQNLEKRLFLSVGAVPKTNLRKWAYAFAVQIFFLCYKEILMFYILGKYVLSCRTF